MKSPDFLNLFGKLGQVKTSEIKAGIKKTDISDQKLQSIFEKIDTDGNSILTDNEIKAFQSSLTSFAKDKNLSENEAEEFMQNLKLDTNINKEDFAKFLIELQSLSENSTVESIEEKRTPGNSNFGTDTQYIITSNGGNTIETINPDKTRTIRTTDAKGNYKEETYDANMQLTQIVQYDEIDKTTTTTKFDKITDPETGETRNEKTKTIETPFDKTIIRYDEEGNECEKDYEKGQKHENYRMINGEYKIIKQEISKGQGVTETNEFNYDIEGKLSTHTYTLGDDSRTIFYAADGKTITHIEDVSGDTTIKTSFENGHKTQEVVTNGKSTKTTTYNEQGFRTKQVLSDENGYLELEYDGKGNTIITRQLNEVNITGFEGGVTRSPDNDSRHAKGVVGERLVVKGELDADDPRIRNRKSAAESEGDYSFHLNDARFNLNHESIGYNCKSSTFDDLITELCKLDGVNPQNGTQRQVRQEMLLRLNPDIKQKGDLKDLNIKIDCSNIGYEKLVAEASKTDETQQKEAKTPEQIQEDAKACLDAIQAAIDEANSKMVSSYTTTYGATNYSISQENQDKRNDAILSSLEKINDPETLDAINNLIKSKNPARESDTLIDYITRTCGITLGNETFSRLVENGAYGDKGATDEVLATKAFNEIERLIKSKSNNYDSYKKSLKFIENNPEAAKLLEDKIWNKIKLTPIDGSYTIAYIKHETGMHDYNLSQLGLFINPNNDIAYNIANNMRIAVHNNIGGVTKELFTDALAKVDKDNVIDVFKLYDQLSTEESLTGAIFHEYANKKAERKQAFNTIMDKLYEKAKETGVPEADIKQMKNNADQLIENYSFVSDLDELISDFINKIETTGTQVTMSDEEGIQQTFELMGDNLTQAQAKFNNFEKSENLSEKTFDILKLVGFGYTKLQSYNPLNMISGSNQIFDDLSNYLYNLTEAGTEEALKTFDKNRKELLKALYNLPNISDEDMRIIQMNFEGIDPKTMNAEMKTAYNRKVELSKQITPETINKFKQVFNDKFKVNYNPKNIALFQETKTKYMNAVAATKISNEFRNNISSNLNENSSFNDVNTKFSKFKNYLKELAKASGSEFNVDQYIETMLCTKLGTGDSNLCQDETKLKNAMLEIINDYQKQLDQGIKQYTGGRSLDALENDLKAKAGRVYGKDNDIIKQVDNYIKNQKSGGAIVNAAAKVALTIAISAALPGGGALATGLISSSASTTSSFLIDSVDATVSKGGAPLTFNEVKEIFINAGIDGVNTGLGGAVGKLLSASTAISLFEKVAIQTATSTASGTAATYLKTGTITLNGVIFEATFNATGALIGLKVPDKPMENTLTIVNETSKNSSQSELHLSTLFTGG